MPTSGQEPERMGQDAVMKAAACEGGAAGLAATAVAVAAGLAATGALVGCGGVGRAVTGAADAWGAGRVATAAAGCTAGLGAVAVAVGAGAAGLGASFLLSVSVVVAMPRSRASIACRSDGCEGLLSGEFAMTAVYLNRLPR